MATLQEMPTFKLTNIIFSKQHSFTVDEITQDIKEIGLTISESDLKRTLNNLKESGMIIQHGSRYSIYNKF